MSTQSSRPASSPLRMRYIRLNPRFDRDETLNLLKSEIEKHAVGDGIKKYPLPVPWLNSKEHQLEFFAIPEEFPLNRSSSFQSGRVYGMDVTSGAAVAALLLDLFDSERSSDASDKQSVEQRYDGKTPLRVLDLCCAPGLKLCMMADLTPPSSTLVGVDMSSQRISLCKNIVKKYHIDGTTSSSTSSHITKNGSKAMASAESNNISGVTIRLYCTDGTTFGRNDESDNANHGLVFDSNAAREEFRSRGKRKRMNKSARAREKRRLLELQRRDGSTIENAGTADNNQLNSKSNFSKGRDEIVGSESVTGGKMAQKDLISKECGESDVSSKRALSVPPFDRVLVDAECSTDGAVRHIEKRQSSSSLRGPAWDDTNMDELVDLQKRLIESGFRLLKPGGLMVYSTCSLSSKQNEQVVRWLLDKCKDAFIIPVSFSSFNKSAENLAFIEESSIPGTIRFNPSINDAGGSLLPGSGFFLAKLGRRL